MSTASKGHASSSAATSLMAFEREGENNGPGISSTSKNDEK